MNHRQKNTEFKNIFRVACVYIGLVIGAGFASGQELISYFVRYEKNGLWGLLLSGILFSVCGWAVMNICVQHKLDGYDQFIEKVFGKKAGFVIDLFAAFFILILFCAMLAGAGAMGRQMADLNYSLVVFAVGFLCFLTVLFDVEGIVKVNMALTPMIIIGGIFFGLYAFFTDYISVFANQEGIITVVTENWIFAFITYTSYNMITAVSVLSNMSKEITSKKVAKYAGIIGGLSLSVLGLCFALPLFLHQDTVAVFEVPMLALAQKHGPLIEMIYAMLLICAIFTTAVSTCFSGVKWLISKLNINETLLKFSFVAISIGLAHIGFSDIVNKVYPAFGLIGIFEMIAIISFSAFKKNH